MNGLFTRRMKRRIWSALPAMLLHHARKRQIGKLRRLPPWADLAAIAAVYEQAREVQNATGQEQHVDHIFPLQGKTVSGLHVANNLRIVPAAANLKKHNKVPDDPEAWQPLQTAPKLQRSSAIRRRGPAYRELFPNSIVRAQRRGIALVRNRTFYTGIPTAATR